MNFGKHGRVLLMGALLAATSTLVFGGLLTTVASADSGTIKIGDYPTDNSGNANDPHLAGACVGIRLFGFDTSKPATATFSTTSPTNPADESKTIFTVDGSSVSPLIALPPQPDGTTQYAYVLPLDFAAGTHAAQADVTDMTGQRGCKTWTFYSVTSSAGPT